MIAHPNFNPVAIEIYGFGIHWYGIMYLLGLAAAWTIGHQLLKRPSFSPLRGLAMEDLIAAAAAGIIIGGRLGYIVFYNPVYFAAHPLQIFYLWNGGMSFHGGLLGVIASLWVLARLHSIPDIREKLAVEDDMDSADDGDVLETVTSQKNIFLRLVDFAAVLTPPGLGLGRLGNFINGELPGRVASADLPWAMTFSYLDYLPRHPSQLYQMFFEGVVLTAIMLYLARAPRAPGVLAGAFLIAYSGGRFFLEYFREPDAHLGLLFLKLSMGQLLCIPMFLLGWIMVYRARLGAWLTALRDEKGDLSWGGLIHRMFAAEPDLSWSAHEQAFADNYGLDDEAEGSGSGNFLRRLFTEKKEERVLIDSKIRLTRREKRRLKKKKKKK